MNIDIYFMKAYIPFPTLNLHKKLESLEVWFS